MMDGLMKTRPCRFCKIRQGRFADFRFIFLCVVGEQKLMRWVGIAIGMNKGHVTRRREIAPRPSRRRGALSQKTKAVRSLIKEVCGYLFPPTAPIPYTPDLQDIPFYKPYPLYLRLQLRVVANFIEPPHTRNASSNC